MATFNSLQMSTPRFPVSGPGIGGRSVKTERGSILAGQVYAVNDIVRLFKLHPRFRVTGGYLKTDGMGTGVTVTVGDAAVPDRYFASQSAATATTVTTLNAAGLDYLNGGAYSEVRATFAGAASNGTGTMHVVLFGYIEEPA